MSLEAQTNQQTNGAAAPLAQAETSLQMFERLAKQQGADEPSAEDTPADAVDAHAAKPAKSAPAPAATTKEPPKDAEGAPVPGEREQFRDWKRKQVAGINAYRDAELGKVTAKQAELDQLRAGTDKLRAAQEALEKGDPEAFAEALGRKSWTELNDEFLNHLSSPTYKQLRQLERESRERKEADARAADERKRGEAEALRREKIGAHLRGMSDELKAHGDPLLAAAAAEFPEIVQLAFGEQRKQYQSEGDEIDSGEAATRSMDALYANARKIVDLVEKHAAASQIAKRLHGARAPKPETAARDAQRPAKRGEPKGAPTHVSHTRAAEASGQQPLDEKALRDKYTRLLEEAEDR